MDVLCLLVTPIIFQGTRSKVAHNFFPYIRILSIVGIAIVTITEMSNTLCSLMHEITIHVTHVKGTVKITLMFVIYLHLHL